MTTILRLGKQQRRQAYIFALLMTAWCFMAGTAAAQTRYYVTPTGLVPTGMDNAWTDVIKLETALEKAEPVMKSGCRVSRKSVKIVSITGRFIWHLKRAGH